jgi:hypothetical protein
MTSWPHPSRLGFASHLRMRIGEKPPHPEVAA